jgi:peptide/nickel transport system permease protein
MLRFFVRRLLLAVVTLGVISMVTFGMFFAVPASPADVLCGRQCSEFKKQQITERLGLNRPITTQYAEYMRGIFVGRDIGSDTGKTHCPAPCLGFSFKGTQEPVLDTVKRVLPVTVSLVAGAAVIWLAFGIALGMMSALRRGTIFDRLAIGTALVGVSMPVYFFGAILLLVVVYTTKIMDFPKYVPITDNPILWAKGLILPWMALAFVTAATYSRLSRAQMLETLSEDFVRTARAKGLPKRQVYVKHALRAAITPIVTIAGLDIGNALGGTVITETVFGLNGLGKEAVNGVFDLNLPIVMATVLLAAFFIVVANLIVDMLYATIDPRVRLR